MAFRKTVRSGYFPPLSFHDFGEYESKTIVSSDSASFVSVSFTDLDELSSRALPLTSLDTLVKSGQRIDGHVSFAGSDPAVIESSVHSAISDYISNTPAPSNPS